MKINLKVDFDNESFKGKYTSICVSPKKLCIHSGFSISLSKEHPHPDSEHEYFGYGDGLIKSVTEMLCKGNTAWTMTRHH